MLPDLPTLKKKREQDITPRILAYFREHHIGTCAIEIKVCRLKSDTIPVSALQEHQKCALLDARGDGIVHKLSDAARIRQPFDAFKIAHAPAYVVAVFPHRGIALAISIEKWRGATPKTPAEFIVRL